MTDRVAAGELPKSKATRPEGVERNIVVTVWDWSNPKAKKFTLISTCFSTHHLVFAEDANNTLWLSSGGAASNVVGWINRRMFEETGDEVKSQGWTPFILDTNGNGKRRSGSNRKNRSYYTWVDQFDTFGLGKDVPK